MTNTTKIIGLTGNIATGKSIIRRMLENTGALGIDADEIAHRMLYPCAPAYQAVVETFGEKIISPKGEIVRSKLGEIVFSNPDKLRKLESLIHPWVTVAIKQRIQQSKTPIIVIEAIKLLESDLKDLCDTIWVSHVSERHQLRRLQQTRGLSLSQAKRRISAQPPSSEKLLQADVVINTNGSFKTTWESIQKALNDTIQKEHITKKPHINSTQGCDLGESGDRFNKGLINIWQEWSPFAAQEIYKYLGEQMILPLFQDGECIAFLHWTNRNFSAKVDCVFPKKAFQKREASSLNAFQHQAESHQCEILILPVGLVFQKNLDLINLGYQKMAVADFSYPAWQAAVKEHTQEKNFKVWAKILAQPIEKEDILTKYQIKN